jgi:hypothetical protein
MKLNDLRDLIHANAKDKGFLAFISLTALDKFQIPIHATD